MLEVLEQMTSEGDKGDIDRKGKSQNIRPLGPHQEVPTADKHIHQSSRLHTKISTLP